MAVDGVPARLASEEAAAATRVVLALTAGVGGMAGAIGLVVAEPMSFVAIPAAALIAAAARRATATAAWCGVAVWITLLPMMVRDAGFVAPVLMIIACLAIAVGPDTLARIVARDFGVTERHSSRHEGWIEDVER